ncbi:MAG: alpha/beta fold hydrolase [Pseudomonadota bacterium]
MRNLVAGICLLLIGAHAPAADFKAGNVSYRNQDVEISARLYMPTGSGPHPAVLFVHGRRGWGEEADMQAQRIAARGFAVIAPDYHNSRFIEAWPETHDPATEKDVELALDFLKTLPQVRSDRVCVVGISRGGYHAVLLAARRPEVACIVTYYGHMVNPNAPEPWQMYRYAPEVDKMNVPTLFIVGEEEFELRRIGIRRAYYALLKRGVPVDIVMYPHARRAFDFRAEQREEEKLATEDAARRTAAFIRSVLKP